MKKYLCILLCLMLSLIGTDISAEEIISLPSTEPIKNIWENPCDSMDSVFDSKNVSFYEIVKSDRPAFYDDFSTLQRTGDGEAYATYEIPYMNSAVVTTYHLASQVVDFTFEVSKDNIEWHQALTDTKHIEEADKWTIGEYKIDNLTDMKYLKIVWPATSDWWTPLVAKISAKTNDPAPKTLEIQCENEFIIPMYEEKSYKMGNPFKSDVVLSIKDSQILGLEIGKNNTISIKSDFIEGSKFTIHAEAKINELVLEKDKIITLKSAILGDLNNDFVIDNKDLEIVTLGYGKSGSDENWNILRLGDINRDLKISVIDIAYIAKKITK
ncbi:MAG: hypothetical protein RSA27_05265 [Oscillospiraceae bacterium]